jgi:hypothetical protein
MAPAGSMPIGDFAPILRRSVAPRPPGRLTALPRYITASVAPRAVAKGLEPVDRRKAWTRVHYVTNLIGNPLDLRGDRKLLPELRFLLAHGGAFAPRQIGRVVQGQTLRHLLDLMGADQVAIGTASPFDMADQQPLETSRGRCAHDPGRTRRSLLQNCAVPPERRAAEPQAPRRSYPGPCLHGGQ